MSTGASPLPSRSGSPVDQSWQSLMDSAASVARNAYAPYSRFHVGAAVRTASGATYLGTNVENISYPVGLCAEAAALAAARAAEGPALRIEAIAIYAEDDRRGHVGCSPCGACRQRILELAPQSMVAFFDPDGAIAFRTPTELLPDAFTFDASDDEREAG